MNTGQQIVIHWFRRDLRLDDNTALTHALDSGIPVLPVFIFDPSIIDHLPADDKRISFIYQALSHLQTNLLSMGSGLIVLKMNPVKAFERLLTEYNVLAVYTNHDYEPYAITRDQSVSRLLTRNGVHFYTFKDQVIFEKSEIVKPDGTPYTIFTPYSKRWIEKYLNLFRVRASGQNHETKNFIKLEKALIRPLEEFGFIGQPAIYTPPVLDEVKIKDYHLTRDIPSLDATSRMSVHLRFGTMSIRKLAAKAALLNPVWLNELQWREFFMQILFHFPEVVNHPFRKQYERIQWRNNEREFDRWSKGETGYPLVDAGMRELAATGFMHNRVRMVAASFLSKHLLIDWRWGEQWFANKLLDFELSSNNGNWQWAAGTGCDAAPYFRIFNPVVQAQRFDPQQLYIRKWIPELDTSRYPVPIVDHDMARKRCLEAYSAARQ